MQCRFCKTTLEHIFIDLQNAPASNSFLTTDQLNEPEVFYPLKVYICHRCFLVQIDEYKTSDAIFNNEYVYFSSYSTTWLKHAEAYCEMMVKRFGFDSHSRIIEVASNDGYLLQYFKKKGIPVLGVEPTANTAEVAMARGIDCIIDFFGVRLAEALAANGTKADLLLGNNVLAHVPDIVDFVAGIKIILKPRGIATMEFPHLMQLVDQVQFDTIYHEHFSYLSFSVVKKIFEASGLELFDVQELPTHGGSLRIYAKHADDKSHPVTASVQELLLKEERAGIETLDYFQRFQEKALSAKLGLLQFLISQRHAGKKVAAYGAAAKGNTLLNYCGVKRDLVSFVVDRNPHKQGKLLPASHIPVVDEDFLKKEEPDYILILPWNLKDEIIMQLSYSRSWGVKFIVAIPELQMI